MPQNDNNTYISARNTLDALIRYPEFRRLRNLVDVAVNREDVAQTIGRAFTSAILNESGSYQPFIFEKKMKKEG